MVYDAGTQMRILIVDDEPGIRFVLRAILERDGHEVLEAQHGVAALESLEGELPDLVMTDLMMPVMGGVELIQRLRSDPRTAGLPIVVVSGNPNAVAEARHADAMLAKPFDPAAILVTVASLLQKGERV